MVNPGRREGGGIKSIVIKSRDQIQLMREAGKIVMLTHELVQRHIKPGVTTGELNKIAHDFIRSRGASPSFLNYRDYPASITTSVNEEIVHGIPGSRKLIDGDIVGIDIGVYYKGFHGDAARTHGVGTISAQDQLLIDTAKAAFMAALEQCTNRNHLNNICKAIEATAKAQGFTCPVELIGHGVGKDLHEEPDIPNVAMPKRGTRLSPGMTLAIEPMLNAGAADTIFLEDGWTALTKDGQKSAHYENTVLITDGEPEILTV